MCDFVFGFCLTLGLYDCWVSNLCLSVCQSVQVMFGMGFVCLSVWRSYVWHGVCLFVRLYKLCLAWGLSVCTSYVWHGVCLFVRLYKLCLAWGLSVCSKHSWLIVFGIFGSPEKDCLLVLKRTVIVSPEKDCLLQQDLYSAFLPGHCSLIIEVVLQVIPLSIGLSSRVSVLATTSSTTNQSTITRHIIIIILPRLLTCRWTLILASEYVVQNHTGHDHFSNCFWG